MKIVIPAKAGIHVDFETPRWVLHLSHRTLHNYFALNPDLIQSTLFTPSGGFTFSAG